jgi:Ca2+/Na+ antiporter
VFVCTISYCILVAPQAIVYEPSIIFRDVGFYIFSILVTFAFAASGQITWWMAVVFLLIYVFYVWLTWYTDKQPAQSDYKEVQKPSGFKPKDTEPGFKGLDGISSGNSSFDGTEIPGLKITQAVSED